MGVVWHWVANRLNGAHESIVIHPREVCHLRVKAGRIGHLERLSLFDGDVGTRVLVGSVLVQRYHRVQSIVAAGELHEYENAVLAGSRLQSIEQGRFAKGCNLHAVEHNRKRSKSGT